MLLVGLLIVALLTVVLLTVSLVTVAMMTATVMEFWACATVCEIILLFGASMSFDPVRDRVQATVLTRLV